MCGNNNIGDKLECPRCGNIMNLIGSDYLCSEHSCRFYAPRIIRRKVISKRDLNVLFKKKETDFIDGFYKKGLNETFSAYLKLNDDWKISIHLDRLTEYSCPLCNENLFRFKNGYECKNNSCKVNKIWDKFRDKVISEDQMEKLLKDRKTDLIKGFISKKNGRRYNGHVIIADNGKVDIEFEESAEFKSDY